MKVNSRSESESETKTKSVPEPAETAAKVFKPWLFWLGIGAFCLLVIVLSITSQRRFKEEFTPQSSLPRFHRLLQELEAVERDGRVVNTAELNGKVRVYAYIYTVCPHGCAAIIGEMLKLDKKFGQRPDFHQVSISVVPERDTAAMMAAYADGIGLTAKAPWWFLTGQREKLWSFMTEGLKLEPAQEIPEEERLNPLDLYAHDLRIVLVDREDYIRGVYSVFHPQAEIASLMCERLQQDVERLLEDKNL